MFVNCVKISNRHLYAVGKKKSLN